MRTLLNATAELGVWGLFFLTTVYGHVALKLAAGESSEYDYQRAARALVSFWGGTAMLAWVLSGFLWVVVLTKNSVLAANSIASLRYVLICLAAWMFLHEHLKYQHGLGLLLVAGGIWLLGT